MSPFTRSVRERAVDEIEPLPALSGEGPSHTCCLANVIPIDSDWNFRCLLCPVSLLTVGKTPL